MQRNRSIASVALASFALAVSSLVPTYGQQDEVINDREIQVIHFADIQYPPLARAAVVQGIVVMRAKLNADGDVTEASALSGSEHLVSSCLDNVKKWCFKPNSRNTVIVLYNFRIGKETKQSDCKHFKVDPPNFATIDACAPKIQ